MTYIQDPVKTQKRLENFEIELIKTYIKDENPNYVKFFKHVLKMLDRYSVNESKEDGNNSYYANLTNLIKFMHVDELPIDNEQILEAFRDDYASTLDFRSKSLTVALEEFRNILKDPVLLYGMKSNSKGRDFYLRLCDEYTYLGETKKFNIDLFFHRTDFDMSNLPPEFDNIASKLVLIDKSADFQVGDAIVGSVSGATATITNVYTDREHVYLNSSTMTGEFVAGDVITGSLSGSTASVLEYNTDTIVYSEIPVYSYNSLLNIVELDTTVVDYNKGNRPFEYQLLSTSSDFNISGLFKYVNRNFKPAGYSCWAFVRIEDAICDVDLMPLCLPKIYLHTAYEDVRVVTSAVEGYTTGLFPPLDWANQGLPLYISGTVSVPYGSGGSFTDEYIQYDSDSSTWVDSSDPLFLLDTINANSDFPLPYSNALGVRNGDTYLIINGAGVTDNDVTKTNTTQTFAQHKIIQWHGDDTGAWY